jgi:hypothetical protein
VVLLWQRCRATCCSLDAGAMVQWTQPRRRLPRLLPGLQCVLPLVFSILSMTMSWESCAAKITLDDLVFPCYTGLHNICLTIMCPRFYCAAIIHLYAILFCLMNMCPRNVIVKLILWAGLSCHGCLCYCYTGLWSMSWTRQLLVHMKVTSASLKIPQFGWFNHRQHM